LWRLVRRSRVVAKVALAGFGMAYAAPLEAAESAPIDDLRWLDGRANAVAALNRTPEECVFVPRDPTRRAGFELGRVAFRSPALLGGIAARVGLSCDSCHVNGHDNPNFVFAGVSGVPGTADVTGSVFSRAREDEIRNPVSIPTLRDAAHSPPFGRVRPSPDLRVFLETVVAEEFQGRPPSASILDALAIYVESLQSAACSGQASPRVSLERDGGDLRRTFAVARAALESREEGTAEFAVLSLRMRLGRLHQRFSGHLEARERIVSLSRSLEERVTGASALSAFSARERLDAAERAFELLFADLRPIERDSLYDDAMLEEAVSSFRAAPATRADAGAPEGSGDHPGQREDASR